MPVPRTPRRFTQFLSVVVAASLFAAVPRMGAQPSPTLAAGKAPGPFFQTETPLTVTLTTNLRQIKRDKGDDAPQRPATLTYAGPDGRPVAVPLQIRTRGIWRLKNCDFPPLRLNFASEDVKNTVFQKLDKPKLVNYCRNSPTFEQYILQELQLYRIYNVLTPASHRVRLLRMAYADSADNKVDATRYSFVIEDPDALADRLGGSILELQGAGPGDFEPFQDALVGIFQYMIGNSDYFAGSLHNFEMVQTPTGVIFPIAYDFDFSGAVNASYAGVDRSLPIQSVRERYYQGFCVPPEQFNQVFALFREKKDAIYALYRDEIGALLTPRIATETLRYFDEFYKTINNPREAQSALIDRCARRPA